MSRFVLLLVVFGVLGAVEPLAPANLNAVAGPTGTDRITITWLDRTTSETGYRVERCRDLHSWVEVAQLPINTVTWTDTGLLAGVLYLYRVRASSATGYSLYSNIAYAPTLRTVAGTTTDTPLRLWANFAAGPAVDVVWTDCFGNETGWLVEREVTGTNIWSTVATPAANTVTWRDTGVALNTAYTYRISAAGPGGPSTTRTATALLSSRYTTMRDGMLGDHLNASLAAPGNLTASSGGTGAIHLSWQASAGATGYRVLWSWDGLLFTADEYNLIPAGTTSCDFSAIRGSVHNLRVIAVDASGVYSAPSATVVASPDVAAANLAKPTNLTVTLNGGLHKLTWVDHAIDETGFAVEMGGIPEDSGHERLHRIAILPANTTTWTNPVDPGGTVWYRVQALRGSASSSYSNTVDFPIDPPVTYPPDPAPAGFTVAATGPTQATASWTTSGMVEIERSTDGITFTPLALVRTAALSYPDRDLVPGSTWKYRARMASPGLWSATVTVTLPQPTTAPLAPVATATAVSRSQVNLAWTAVANVASYRIEKAASATGPWTLVTTPAALDTMASAIGLPAGTTYFRMRADNVIGSSPWSTVVSAATLASDPLITRVDKTMALYKRLVITGTAANDSISVSQTGNNITVVANNVTTTHTGPYGEVVVYGKDGDDQISTAATLTVRALLYAGNGNDTVTALGSGRATIVTLGEGRDTCQGNGSTTAYWADEAGTDTVTASSQEIAAGRVHQVREFYQPTTWTKTNAAYVSKDPRGQRWAAPGMYTASIYLANNPMFGIGANAFDVNQGLMQDCPMTSLWQGFADAHASLIEDFAVDCGDNTFAAALGDPRRGIYMRVDGKVKPMSLSQPGFTANQWWLILEKIYVFGYFLPSPADVCTMTNISIHGLDSNQLYTQISGALNRGEIMQMGGIGCNHLGLELAYGGHFYGIIGAWKASDNTPRYLIRNPYGLHTDMNLPPANPQLGLYTVTDLQLRANWADLVSRALTWAP